MPKFLPEEWVIKISHSGIFLIYTTGSMNFGILLNKISQTWTYIYNSTYMKYLEEANS
jgi:hypothetical protein